MAQTLFCMYMVEIILEICLFLDMKKNKSIISYEFVVGMSLGCILSSTLGFRLSSNSEDISNYDGMVILIISFLFIITSLIVLAKAMQFKKILNKRHVIGLTALLVGIAVLIVNIIIFFPMMDFMRIKDIISFIKNGSNI